MAFIPAVNTVKIALEYTVAGKVVVNIFYLRKSNPIIVIDLTNIAAALKSWWSTYMKPFMSSELSLTTITLQDITIQNGARLVSPVIPPEVGSTMVNAVPNNVSLVTTFKSGLSGRSLNGRAYNVGMTEADVSFSNATLIFAAGMAGAWTNMNSYVVPLGFEHVIVSFEGGGLPRPTGLISKVATYLSNTRVDTQRRRLPF